MRIGNGRFESTQFNSRLQPTQIALGTSANNTSLLKLNYDYGTTDNNGNVKSQTITVPGMNYPLIQTYSYDSLNRLTSAEEKSNNVQQWIQSFTFDRYGNRRINANATTPSLVGPNPVISESNNRITPQTGEQYLYDSAGNLTRDKDGHTFVYDGENKQITYNGGAGTSNGANYFYDGDGKRVKKIVGTNSIVTIFVYDAGGKLVAEYETNAPQTGGKIQYTTQDTLGSPRILTDEKGEVTSRRDFLPFGEEIQSGMGGRTTQQGYVADNIRQKFTQKERDDETSLDYFINRYYSSAHGRFTSVDPGNTGADEDDPQSWNGYAYARSNPVLYTDPNGLAYIVCDPNGKNCSTVTDQQFYDARRADTKAGFEYTGNRDFFEGGQIKADGQVQYTYQQISIDDPTREFIFQMRRQTAPIPKATLAFFGLSAALGTGGGVAYYYLGAATTSTVLNIGYRAVNLGRKLDYILGKATGSVKNVQRSQSMLREMERAGLPDSPATRQYLTEHLTQVARQSGGITQANGRVVKESLLMGPGGKAVKLETIWEGTKLITIKALSPK